MEHDLDILAEMEMAYASRAAGNEGRARVCARRAAGMAARNFLSRHKVDLNDVIKGRLGKNSAYITLQALAAYPGLPPNLKRAAENLTMRVNPEFQLPNGIDLIDEASRLIGGLK